MNQLISYFIVSENDEATLFTAQSMLEGESVDLQLINSRISRLCALHWLPTVCVDLVKAPKIKTGLGVSVSRLRVE